MEVDLGPGHIVLDGKGQSESSVVFNRVCRKCVCTCVLVPCLRCRDLSVQIHKFFLPHVYLAPPMGVTSLEFQKDLCHQKPKMLLTQW